MCSKVRSGCHLLCFFLIMGNENGKPTCSLGIAALAVTTTAIEKNEISELAKKCFRLANAGTNPDKLTRADFETAIKTIESFQVSDTELFDRTFTMFDAVGDNEVDAKEFIVSTCALISGSVADKLMLAFQLYDVNNVGTVTRGDMKKVLHAMNNLCSYVGDAVVSVEEVDTVVLDTFGSSKISSVVIDLATIQKITDHEIMENFLSGDGTVRFGR